MFLCTTYALAFDHWLSEASAKINEGSGQFSDNLMIETHVRFYRK